VGEFRKENQTRSWLAFRTWLFGFNSGLPFFPDVLYYVLWRAAAENVQMGMCGRRRVRQVFMGLLF